MQCRTISEIAILKASESNFEHGFLSIIVFNILVNLKISPSNAWYIQKPYDTECSLTRRMVNLESVLWQGRKGQWTRNWDENQDYGKILYFSSSRILVKKMGKRWSFFRISFSGSTRLTPNLWIHPSQLLGVKKEMTPVTTNLTTTEMLRKVKKSHSPSLFYNKIVVGFIIHSLFTTSFS